MEAIIAFAKFGEIKHLKKILEGRLYFSTTREFNKIEEELCIKGQGDKLDGKLILDRFHFSFGDIDLTPIFCITALTKKEISNDNYPLELELTEDFLSAMLNDFPKSDGVLVIREIDKFIDTVEKIFDFKVVHNHVRYFDFKAMDSSFYTYIFEDDGKNLDNQIVTFPNGNKGRLFSIREDSIFRLFLTKDSQFCNQNEYRFLGVRDLISEPMDYIFSNELDMKLYRINKGKMCLEEIS